MRGGGGDWKRGKEIDNLLEQKQLAKYPTFQQYNDKLQPKFVPRFAKNFIISDSSYRKINQQDFGPLTAIHSYSSANINDVNNIVDKYTYEPKVETRVMHVGHKSIDAGLTGKESKYLQNNNTAKKYFQ